jgi:hypothetical protein
MPLPSQDHCSFLSFPVVDWFCLFLYTYEFWLYLWKIVRSSVILLLPLFTYIKVEQAIVMRYWNETRPKSTKARWRSSIRLSSGICGEASSIICWYAIDPFSSLWTFWRWMSILMVLVPQGGAHQAVFVLPLPFQHWCLLRQARRWNIWVAEFDVPGQVHHRCSTTAYNTVFPGSFL